MLPRLIDQLLEQNYPQSHYEILIVDGRSADGTAELIRRRYGRDRLNIRVVDNPKIGSAAGRNAGLRAASGDVIVFLTAHDSIPSRNLLADTATILAQTGVGCLCPPRPLRAPAATRMGEAIAQVSASWLGRFALGEAPNHPGFVDATQSGATYLWSVFEQVGLYDENFDACEDVEFNTRVQKAGVEAYTDPRLTVHEEPPRTLATLLRGMFCRGRGTSRLMRKQPDWISLEQVAPLGILLALLLALVAWQQLTTVIAGIVTLPLVLLPGAVAVASLQLGWRYGTGSAWRAPWIFAAIYGGQGIGLLYEYFRPARRGAAALGVLEPRESLSESDRAA